MGRDRSGRFSEEFPKSKRFLTASCASSWAILSWRSSGLAPFSAKSSFVSSATLPTNRVFSGSRMTAAWRRISGSFSLLRSSTHPALSHDAIPSRSPMTHRHSPCLKKRRCGAERDLANEVASFEQERELAHSQS